jgi:hypothetical protein
MRSQLGAQHDAGARFDYVIGVCDREALDGCPVFPAERRRLAAGGLTALAVCSV